jgi:hypothetical protein
VFILNILNSVNYLPYNPFYNPTVNQLNPANLALLSTNNKNERDFNKQSGIQLKNFRKASMDVWTNSNHLTNYGLNNVLTSRLSNSTSSAIGVNKVSNNASLNVYQMSVSQLATNQINESDIVNNSNTTGFNTGTNKMQISLNSGENINVQVDVSNTDTELDIINNIANSINGSHSKISATVLTDNVNGTSSLQIQSNDTGSNDFIITDTQGALSGTYNLNKITQLSQDSVYQVNGATYTSQSNNVNLDNAKVSLTLNNITNGTTISVSPNANLMSSGISSLISSLNSALTATSDASQYLQSFATNGYKDVINDHLDILNQMGITFKDNQLKIDQTTMDNFFTSVQNNTNGAINSAHDIQRFAEDVNIHARTLISTSSNNLQADNPYTHLTGQLSKQAYENVQQNYLNSMYYQEQVLTQGLFVNTKV